MLSGKIIKAIHFKQRFLTKWRISEFFLKGAVELKNQSFGLSTFSFLGNVECASDVVLEILSIAEFEDELDIFKSQVTVIIKVHKLCVKKADGNIIRLLK